MKIKFGKINFKSIDTSRLDTLGNMYLSSKKDLELITKNVEVTLSSSKKSFPYRKSTLPVRSIKIVARKKGLNFIEKLFGYHKVVDYYPIGNLRNLITFKFKGTFEDFLKKTIAKVK